MNNKPSYSETSFVKPTEMYGPDVIVLEMFYQFMKNYNYLVVDRSSKQAVIVDPAWEMEKIDSALIEAQAHLAGILVTHSHPDHIHLAAALAEKYNCSIWMSHQEIESSGFYAKQLVAIDETPWKLGGMTIQPVLTPGHTPGCVCYQIGDNLFTGDVLFAEGCGMCPNVNAAHEMFTSLTKLKTTLDPHTRIFPGHSYGKEPGQLFSNLLKDNIYLQFQDCNSFAAFRLRSGQNKAKMFNFS
jgi:hydroxyacylglutathione hydrolase